jgi:hypothetical protein
MAGLETTWKTSLIAGLLLLGTATPVGGQSSRATDLMAGISAKTAAFGALTPGRGGGMRTMSWPCTLAIPQAMALRGYRIQATSTFQFTPAARNAGGKDLVASDIAIGVEGISSTLGHAGATIAAGFEPSAGGRATLADLMSGREILRVPKVSPDGVPAGGGQMLVTLRLGVPSQYFTPGEFSATVTMTVTD